MTGLHPNPLDPFQELEPAVQARLLDGTGGIRLNAYDAAQVSMAISLKRIADAIEKAQAEVAGCGGLNTLLWQLGDSFGRGMRP